MTNPLPILTHRQVLPATDLHPIAVLETVALTAEERTRSRAYIETETGQPFYLHLARGTVLQQGDILRSPEGDWQVRVVAKPELVLTVTAQTSIELLRAAYHLGNRHVSLEVASTYLRLSPDPVLKAMLEQLGVIAREEIAPFQPETGAYSHPAHAADDS